MKAFLACLSQIQVKYSCLGFVMKSIWFIICLVLFSYNAWRCLDEYFLFETVTKSSQEEQKAGEFPMICLGPSELSKNRIARLNMTPHDYQIGGKWRTEKLTEIEVYNSLSLTFEKLVKEIEILNTTVKNSEAYEKVKIKSEDLKFSEVKVMQSDYYYELKRTCLAFPLENFPFGIQEIDFHMRTPTPDNVIFFVTSPGNSLTRKRSFNEFTYAGGFAKYGIEYTLRHSLNLKRSPCSEDTFGKEDSCLLGIINALMIDSFNCTAPWLLHAARWVCMY